MPNGKQAKVYEFESWGWSPPALETPVGTTEPATPGEPEKQQYEFEQWGWEVPGQGPSVEVVDKKNREIEDLHQPSAEDLTFTQTAMANFALDRDIVDSEYMSIKQMAGEGNEWALKSLEGLDKEVKRKSSFGEGIQYLSKRAVSLAPFVELEWQKHRPTPLEHARSKDPDAPQGVYDPVSAAGLPVGFGQEVTVRDAADLAGTIGEFAIIGGLTKVPFQAALKASKTGKLTSGAYRLFTKNKKLIPVLKHTANANINFQIHNLATFHEGDLDENSTFGKKVRARFERIPATALTATLFGSLGSFKNVYAQYGGVFTAGYTTTMIEAMKSHRDPETGEVTEGLSASEAHGEAFKSGLMLMGVHAVNALGVKAGKARYKKKMKDMGISDEAAEMMAGQIVEQKISKEKQLFKSAEKDPPVVTIEKEVRLKNNQRAFVVKDAQNEQAEPQTIRLNEFYKSYEKTNHPKTAEQIRNKRLGKVHSLQNQLKMSDVEQYTYKRKIMNVKGKPPVIKEGELPYYIDLQSKTAGELKVIADQVGLKYNVIDNKATMIERIEENIPKSKGEYLSWADANPRQLYEAQTKLSRYLQVRKVKEDVQKGLYRKGLNDDGNKIFKKTTLLKGKPSDTEVHTERIITDYEGSVQRGLLDTQNKVKELHTIYVQEEIKPEASRRVLMAKAGELDPTNLNPTEVKLLEIYTKQMEQGAIFAKDNGILESVIDNYWTGMFPNVDAKTLKQIRAKSTRSGETQYSKEKLYLLPSEAEKAGLKPVYDLRDLTGSWWDAVNKASANKTLFERLADLPTIDGNTAISGEYTPGYAVVDNSVELSKAVTGSQRKKVYVHPELSEQVKILLDPKSPTSKSENALLWINNGVKRIIMVNPLIHGWNIYSDVMDEYNFRLLKSGRVIMGGEKLYLMAKRAGYVQSKAEWNEYSKGEQLKINDKILMEMAGEGIGIAETQALTKEFDNFYKKNYSELSVSDAEFSKKLKMFGNRLKKNPLKTLRMSSDNFLWDKIVKNAQISIYALTKSRAMKAGLSEVDSRRVSAHYTKDLLGMLPKSVFASSGMGGSKFLNYLFFARNWTISNMRLISGAAGYRGKNLPRFLSHKGLATSEMKFLQEQYASHVIKGIMGTVISVNLLNYAFTGIKEVLDAAGNVVGYTWDKAKAHWATENEEGHKLDIDTGTYNRKGDKVYVENLIFRYIKDYYNWFEDPLRTFLNKVHPVPKASVEQIVNLTLWNQRKIIEYPDQMTMAEKAKKRAQHLLYAVTPYGQFVGQPNKLRTNIEKIAPLFGTWIKSGVAGGEYGNKINKFIDKKNYVLDEIDKQIDLIAQTGDMSYVIDELIKNKRFKTIDGIRDRLQKYKNPLLYKYNIILRSKADKYEFLQTLTAKQREEFFEALEVGNKGLKFYTEKIQDSNKIQLPLSIPPPE